MSLAIVFLRGGADGLSILAPLDDPGYRAARPSLALDGSTAPHLHGPFGLTRDAPGLRAAWQAGRLALIPACGFGGQTRSHFGCQVELEQGASPAAGPPGAGWIARHLTATAGDTPNPFRGVVVRSAGLAPTMRGTDDALACDTPSTIRLGRFADHRVVRTDATPTVDAIGTAWTGVDHAAATGLALAARVLALAPNAPGNRFGEDDTARAFAAAADILDADHGTEVVMVNLDGWDTHQHQADRLPELIARLDSGLTALAEHERRAGRSLTTLVVTEFGRRVAENSSGGTDHGTGGLAMVLGDGVAGGVVGRWPGLASLEDGDVPAMNNLRAVMAEIAAKVLRTPDPALVISGVGPSDWLGVLA